MFVCRRCGACCRWEGAVKVDADEVDAIAAFLGIPIDEFLEKHTRLTPDRKHLSLMEKSSGECEFLGYEEGLSLCLIDQVKPRQCRDFPARWNFPGWRTLCEGGK